jgi:uncharacterized protein (UPF0332 family)
MDKTFYEELALLLEKHIPSQHSGCLELRVLFYKKEAEEGGGVSKIYSVELEAVPLFSNLNSF